MQKTTITDKLLLAFGIITILSGIYLILEEDYVIGISGSIVGAWLTYQNWTKLNKEKKEVEL